VVELVRGYLPDARRPADFAQVNFEYLGALERLGVDPDGNLYEKAKMVADTREAPKEFISNHLNDVKVRFFGDTAVAQGNESWVRRTAPRSFRLDRHLDPRQWQVANRSL
jgi:hypothetical protein